MKSGEKQYSVRFSNGNYHVFPAAEDQHAKDIVDGASNRCNLHIEELVNKTDKTIVMSKTFKIKRPPKREMLNV